MSEQRTSTVLLCDAETMAALADLVSNVLGTRLHKQTSPMIGPWYTSIDLTALHRAFKAGNLAPGLYNKAVTDVDPEITLTLNDPEPGYASPDYKGGAEFILGIEGSPAVVENAEYKLVAAGAGTIWRK
jgi:hypothetical protein